jgi:hypothetical protein
LPYGLRPQAPALGNREVVVCLLLSRCGLLLPTRILPRPAPTVGTRIIVAIVTGLPVAVERLVQRRLRAEEGEALLRVAPLPALGIRVAEELGLAEHPGELGLVALLPKPLGLRLVLVTLILDQCPQLLLADLGIRRHQQLARQLPQRQGAAGGIEPGVALRGRDPRRAAEVEDVQLVSRDVCGQRLKHRPHAVRPDDRVDLLREQIAPARQMSDRPGEDFDQMEATVRKARQVLDRP